MNPVDEYIKAFPATVQERLITIRQLFFQLSPNVEESIRYKMPAYKVGKHHLYFAAYKKHIGMYPVYGLGELEKEIKSYRAKNTKDSIHFLHSEALPIQLIKSIIIEKSKQN
ncbi:DUF1801 domain-containing protein [Chryseotalea sanaruensis]|uniref:DUF1801 domain-containing protein n=1 Tax=Chryseotalea sanaruensis TaxID=2482724 RepID=A0A401U986_9BACT|nr:DUF1801 domain-containing protein [Chryseotalea sanaruensis]GCC51447.1 DUF1801 domain-containing protein [Chryseotalea sanaruensis]